MFPICRAALRWVKHPLKSRSSLPRPFHCILKDCARTAYRSQSLRPSANTLKYDQHVEHLPCTVMNRPMTPCKSCEAHLHGCVMVSANIDSFSNAILYGRCSVKLLIPSLN